MDVMNGAVADHDVVAVDQLQAAAVGVANLEPRDTTCFG